MKKKLNQRKKTAIKLIMITFICVFIPVKTVISNYSHLGPPVVPVQILRDVQPPATSYSAPDTVILKSEFRNWEDDVILQRGIKFQDRGERHGKDDPRPWSFQRGFARLLLVIEKCSVKIKFQF